MPARRDLGRGDSDSPARRRGSSDTPLFQVLLNTDAAACHWDPKKVSNLPTITQPGGGGGSIWTQWADTWSASTFSWGLSTHPLLAGCSTLQLVSAEPLAPTFYFHTVAKGELFKMQIRSGYSRTWTAPHPSASHAGLHFEDSPTLEMTYPPPVLHIPAHWPSFLSPWPLDHSWMPFLQRCFSSSFFQE